MKIQSYKFFDLKFNTKYYSKIYEKVNLSESYPANLKRLQILLPLIQKYKPKKIIDAGCGAGIPLIKIKKMGFNIYGYDKSINMVKQGKINLKKNNLDENLIQLGNFENAKHIKDNSVNCILGMGTFYYSKKFIQTLKNQKRKLKKNGHLIFSLRNQLFDIATLNDYSIKYYSKLYKINKFKPAIKKRY